MENRKARPKQNTTFQCKYQINFYLIAQAWNTTKIKIVPFLIIAKPIRMKNLLVGTRHIFHQNPDGARTGS